MMVRLGANLNKRNALGHTPIDVAEKHRHKKVLLLTLYGSGFRIDVFWFGFMVGGLGFKVWC